MLKQGPPNTKSVRPEGRSVGVGFEKQLEGIIAKKENDFMDCYQDNIIIV